MIRLSEIEDEPWIVPHLEQIALESRQPSLVKDATKACKEKRAFLFLTETGFLIVKPRIKNLVTQLLLWVAWDLSSKQKQLYDAVDELARKIEADELVFLTKIKALERPAKAQGFEYVGTENGFYEWRKRL